MFLKIVHARGSCENCTGYNNIIFFMGLLFQYCPRSYTICRLQDLYHPHKLYVQCLERLQLLIIGC
jgi:hypothetical protein